MIKTLGISLSCRLRPRISEFLPNDAAATAGSKCPLWGWSQLTEITQAPRSPVNPKAERRLTVYGNIILFLYHLAFWQNEPKCGQRRKHSGRQHVFDYKPNICGAKLVIADTGTKYPA